MIKKLSSFFGVALLSLLPLGAVAQDDLDEKLKGDLHKYIHGDRSQDEYKRFGEEYIKKHPAAVLKSLNRYRSSNDSKVRWKASALSQRVGVDSIDPKIRGQVTGLLIKDMKDADNFVNQTAARNLLSYFVEDFTNASKAMLHELLMEGGVTGLTKNGLPVKYVVMVVGVAGMKEEFEYLETLVGDEDDWPRGWGTANSAAVLARARLGSEADAMRVVEHFRKIKFPRPMIGFLEELAYARHPVTIEVLMEFLESDERVPATSDIGTPAYNQFALDYLADILEGFPVKRNFPRSYTRNEVERARKWMKNKKNWINKIRR